MTKRYYMALALSLIAAIVGIGAVTRHSGAVPGVSSAVPGAFGGVPGASAEREIPSFSGATAWLNTQPLTPADLHGKVVLVEFWTYTCINWRRTLPYVRAWAARYKDKGLVVIGVSTPEFSFEKNINNVQRALKEMRMDFPIAIDNNYGVWRAFDNEYWPALYFIDAKGHIRHHQFGEGDYEESEMVIQQLLAETGAKDIPAGLSPVMPGGAELAADMSTLGSGETYIGYGRTENFSSVGNAVYDKPHVYATPPHLQLNQWALDGDWTLREEAAALNKAGGRITYHFHARDVNLIMGPAKPGDPVRFRVLIDGHAPGSAHGIDVDEQGNGKCGEQGMYQLIRQPGPIINRDFTIEFLDPGVEAFDFTFG
jgi:thiol-disulfide isomerase/thioredoxin